MWHYRWRHFIKVRNNGQNQRCQICAELTARRRTAVTTEEKAELAAAKQDHVQRVKACRVASRRSTAQAEHDAKNPTVDGTNQVLKIFIDGQDQAKWRLPRHLLNSKFFSKKF